MLPPGVDVLGGVGVTIGFLVEETSGEGVVFAGVGVRVGVGVFVGVGGEVGLAVGVGVAVPVPMSW